jgi:hypothetical protein
MRTWLHRNPISRQLAVHVRVVRDKVAPLVTRIGNRRRFFLVQYKVYPASMIRNDSSRSVLTVAVESQYRYMNSPPSMTTSEPVMNPAPAACWLRRTAMNLPISSADANLWLDRGGPGWISSGERIGSSRQCEAIVAQNG